MNQPLCFVHRAPSACTCFAPPKRETDVLVSRRAAVEVHAMSDGAPSGATLSAPAVQDLAMMANSYVVVGDALVDFMGQALTEERMIQLVEVVRMLKEAGFGAVRS